MLRIIQTWNGQNINDGTSYKATLINPDELPAASPVFVSQPGADPEDTGLYSVEVATLAIYIRVVNYASRNTLIPQLKKWFKRGTVGDLVVLFTDDSLSYYKTARVVNLVRDPDTPMAFIATLNTGFSTWRASITDTYSWALTGTGGNYTLALNGDDEAPLSINFSMSAAPTSGYLYQRLYQLLTVANVPALGLGPWNVTLDTAALIADNTNKCQINQVGGITSGATTIAYDTVTGSIPSAGSGYVDSEQISWTGKTGTTSGNLTGVTRGIGGTTAATHADNAEIKLSKILANCADVRVFIDNKETRRWIPNPNNASSKIWFNINLTQPGYSLALGTAIVSTADISYITFADTPNVYAAIAAMPVEGVLVRSTEWIRYRRVDNGPTVKRLAVLQRGVMGTTKTTHAVGDVFQYMEHVVTICYGNITSTDPSASDTTYDDTKPVFNLTSSTNSSWVYDATSLFVGLSSVTGTSKIDRTGVWRGTLSRQSKYSYQYNQDGQTGTAPALGMRIGAYPKTGGGWVADTSSLTFDLYRACGIDTTTMTGEKYRDTVQFPAVAALQKSADGIAYSTVWNESSPASVSTWTALAAHSGDVIGNVRWIRLLFSGTFESGIPYSFCAFEVQTATINFTSANLPTGTLISVVNNAQLDLTFTNNTNGDAFDTDVPMLVGLNLVMDAEARTILFNSVPAHDGIVLNSEARETWIRLQPGNNSLTVSAVSVGTMTALLTWRKRRF